MCNTVRLKEDNSSIKIDLKLNKYFLLLMNYSKPVELNHISSFTTNISKTLIEEINILLKTIAGDYNISIEDINNKYYNNIVKINNIINGKKRTRRVLPKDMTCKGRKLDGDQCTRQKLTNIDFCLTHQKALPNGRIDDKNYKKRERGRRGRKPKNKNSLYNNPDYIATKLETINGEKYLVNIETNDIYTYNIDNPELLGKKNVFGTIDYY